MTKKNFAKLQKVAESTIYRRIQKGILNEYKVPHRITTLMSEKDITNYK